MKQLTKRNERAWKWVWAAISLQALGYVIDIVWHGLARPGAEPTTFDEMVRHLATVHLPLYVGCACVLVATALALARRISESRTRLAVAFAGALLSAAAEAWHAYSHLVMDRHHAPLAGILSAIGFVVVVVATWGASHRGIIAGTRPASPNAGR